MRMIRLQLLLLFSISGIFLSGGKRCFGQPIQDNRNPYHLGIIRTMKDYERQVAENRDMQMKDLAKETPDLVMDIRYATTNNFTGEVIYASSRAFVRKPVASAIRKIQDSLKPYGLGLKIYDAYRPYSATLRFFKVYPDTNFVANPRYGSRHNRGCAVDLTLVDRVTGKELSMPTPFDDFTPQAHSAYSDLPDLVMANRKFLFDMMACFGFKPISTEWWHFDFTGWEKYPLMDLSFEELDKVRSK